MQHNNNTNNNKLGWKILLETQIRNLIQQAKIIREEKRWNMLGRKEKKTTQVKQTIQFEEINQKVLMKEGRPKYFVIGQNDTDKQFLL